MIHHRLMDNSENHWGVSYTGELPPGFEPKVLVQVHDKTDQARIAMTPDEAEYMAMELLRFAEKTRQCKPLVIEEK